MAMKTGGTMLLRAKLVGAGRHLLEAGKHNLREISGPHIDDGLSHQNVTLFGPARAVEIAEAGNTKMRAAGIDLATYRKNGTRAGEIIFGLPATTSVDINAYFKACVQWVVEYFGDVLLSAVIHRDEKAPHLHVLMAPMKAGKWLASKVFGGREDIKALHSDFFCRVASGFGVRRAPERLRAADRRLAAQNVLEHLRAAGAPVINCQTWPVVRDFIEADPRPWAEQLGLSIHVRHKTLAELKVSPGRGPKRERTAIEDFNASGRNTYPVLGLPSKGENLPGTQHPVARANVGVGGAKCSLSDAHVDDASLLHGLGVDGIDGIEVRFLDPDFDLADDIEGGVANSDRSAPQGLPCGSPWLKPGTFASASAGWTEPSPERGVEACLATAGWLLGSKVVDSTLCC